MAYFDAAPCREGEGKVLPGGWGGGGGAINIILFSLLIGRGRGGSEGVT